MATDGPATRFAGTPHLRSISSHERRALSDGWQVAGTPPGAATHPCELASLHLKWLDAQVPGTVASAIRAGGGLPSLERCEDFDASDWWFRVRLSSVGLPGRVLLRCAGLASLAELWLDGEPIGTSSNMFQELVVDLSARMRGSHELAIRFPSLRAELDRPHPRPRWRTALVEHQALRWHRTTLLGRMPGWCPPVRAVGPWQPIWLEHRRTIEVLEGDVLPVPSSTGDAFAVDLLVRGLDDVIVRAAELVTALGNGRLDVTETASQVWRLSGLVPVRGAGRWWPHTHGGQPRHEVAVAVETTAGRAMIDVGELAFRAIVADRSDDGFTIRVNDTPVFCRGVCWTPVDLVTLRGEDAALRRRLELVRDAGLNMVRVSGVMAYEDARFHRWCDELGILVWQDFMFARMDYPAEEPDFADQVRAEATAVVADRRRWASTAVWCGNSEVAQTSAMLGMESEAWSSPLFDALLPAVVAASGSDAPYLPTSPIGGPLPFTPSSGTAHYFGVGAMLRPLDDARRSGIRFAAECLGLANVGESPALPSDPAWRASVPRDPGTAWDFEDVRDHYAAQLFGVQPAEVRRADPERYVAMSRLASAEVMRRTLADWRRAGSSCAGALIWFVADVTPGTGWGLLDDEGRPKAPWHALRSLLAPRAVFLTEEGLAGLVAHVANDSAEALHGTLELTLYRDGRLPLATGRASVNVAPRGVIAVSADAILRRFTDIAWTYRFGPPSHDVVMIELRDHDGTLLGSDLYLPQGLTLATSDVPLVGRIVHADAQEIQLELESDRLAYAVRIEAGGWFVADNYVHVAPGRRVLVRAAGPAASRPTAVVARPFNARAGLRLDVPPSTPD